MKQLLAENMVALEHSTEGNEKKIGAVLRNAVTYDGAKEDAFIQKVQKEQSENGILSMRE